MELEYDEFDPGIRLVTSGLEKRMRYELVFGGYDWYSDLARYDAILFGSRMLDLYFRAPALCDARHVSTLVGA